MPPIESELSRINGELVDRKVVPEQTGEYPIGVSTWEVHDIIPGKRNGWQTVKAVIASVDPPYSDGRKRRYSLNGRPSDDVPAEAENTLAGGRFKHRIRIVPENWQKVK